MTADLEAAATAAGLVDMDLLRIAREGLSPADAVRDLRSRYPGAFRTPGPAAHDVRGMSRADADAEVTRYLAELQRHEWRRREQALTDRVLAYGRTMP